MIPHSDLRVQWESGLEPRDIESLADTVQEIHNGLTDLRRLGQMPFRELPYHDEATKNVLMKAREVQDHYDHVLVLGIGGSALGPDFLVKALGREGFPKVIVCDSVDPFVWKSLSQRLPPRKTALVVISKSGETLETLAALAYFRQFFPVHLVVTDPKDGRLRRMAREEHIESLDVPSGVGGRYSVLSPVGLFPAACAGVDIEALLTGARRMDDRCRGGEVGFSPASNPALTSAALHFLYETKKGRRIRVVMTYGERLKGYGAWFSQLWAESLGKSLSLKGKEVFAGTTPIAASGPQDQHSQLQLYLQGPQDKVVTFVGAEEEPDDIILPPAQGGSVHRLLQIEREATQQALTDVGRPSQTLLLRQPSPQAVGELLYMAEVETVYAGALSQVNPFDQPAVEAIKRNIHKILSTASI